MAMSIGASALMHIKTLRGARPNLPSFEKGIPRCRQKLPSLSQQPLRHLRFTLQPWPGPIATRTTRRKHKA